MELFLDPLDSDALLHVEGRAQMQSATVSFDLKDISCTYMYRATPDNLFTPAGEIFASFSYAASGNLFDTDISLKHTEYSILRKVVHDFSTTSTVSSEIKLNCDINFAVSWYYFIGVNSHFFISHAVNVQNVKSHGLFSSSNEAFSTGNSEMNWEPHLTVHPQADSSIHMMHLLLNLRVRSFRDAGDVEALLVHLSQLDYIFTLVDRASELKSYFRLSTESLTVDFAIDKPIANIDVRLNCTPAIIGPEQVQNTTLDHCNLLSPIDFAMLKAELNQNKFVNITALSLAKSFVSSFMGEYHFVRSIDNAMFLGETFSDDFAASIGTCSLQVPPSNFTFVITLALLTMIVTIPLDILTSLPLDEYASKRPDWSKWASKSDPYRMHECEEKSLFLERAKSVKKFEVFLGEAVASTSSTRRSIHQAPTKLSVVAEAEKLKCEIQQHFKDIVDHNAFLTQDESLALEDVKRARTEALNSIFHISAQGKFEHNMLTRLSCESSGDYILNVLKKSQESTDQLERTLRKISNRIRDPMFSDEWNLWDKLLLSQFVTEQLSPFKRWILVTKMACFDD
jgi:hypothetical protein